MPPHPQRITNYEDYRYYRKQLDYAIQHAREAEAVVLEIRLQTWYVRLLSVFELLSWLKRLARCRLRSVALHDLLTEYNRQSGYARMLPELPISWRSMPL